MQRSWTLPDYLWGIETFLGYKRCTVKKASRLPMRNWNERTIRNCSPNLNRFQTTYEELKPSSFYPILFFALASRLPMRNWNVPSLSEYLQTLMLPDYLWGIETLFQRVDLHLSLSRFQTTYEELKRSKVKHIDIVWCSFQTTYEELKRVVDFGLLFLV